MRNKGTNNSIYQITGIRTKLRGFNGVVYSRAGRAERDILFLSLEVEAITYNYTGIY